MDKEEIKQILRQELAYLIRKDRYTFNKLIQILDGRNIQTGLTTGTKIGTATTQKLSLYGVTPIVQQSAITAAPSMSGAYNQTEQQQQSDRINNLITALENIGIIAKN